MTVLTVRAKVKEEHVADAEAAVKRILRPSSVTFLAMLEVEDGVENPLAGLPEAQEFYASLPGWYAEPPEVGPGTVIGSYRLFSDAPCR